MAHQHVMYPQPTNVESFEGSPDEVKESLARRGVPPEAIALVRSEVAAEGYARTKCTAEVVGSCNDDQGRAGERRKMTCVDLDEKGQEIEGSKDTRTWCHHQRPDE